LSFEDKIGMAKSFYADDFISWFSTAIDNGHISVENLDPIHLKISAALNKQFEKLDLDIAGAQTSSNYTRTPISLDLPPNKDSNTIPLSGIKRTADAQKLEKRLLSENPLKIISRINTKYPTSLEKQDAWERNTPEGGFLRKQNDFDGRFYRYISKNEPQILLGNPEKSLVSKTYKNFVKSLTQAYQKGFISIDLNQPSKHIRGVQLEEYTDSDKDRNITEARNYEAGQIRTVLSDSFEKIQQNWDASANINNDFYIGLTLYIKNMSNNPLLTQQGAMLSQNDKVSLAIETYVNDLANFHEKGLVHVINPKNPIESNIIGIQQAVPNKLEEND
ncbi:MAG: hypothetical protein WCG42_06430, partial [Parachlamydiaceae bacterium]